MTDLRKIKAKDIINDIQSGLRAHEIMEKYNLSTKGLRSAIDQLVGAGAVTRGEVWETLSSQAEEAVLEDVRSRPRYAPEFDLPVYDSNYPTQKGRIRDITEGGMGLAGIEGTVGEVKSFVILGDESGLIDPFEFEAECRWLQKSHEEEYVSGYEIVHISQDDRRELSKLIGLVAGY